MRIKHAVIASVIIATTGTASSLDLTTPGSGSINGAWFETAFLRSTGTGNLDPFVRVQANGTAEGYNTDIAPPVGQPMPDVMTGTWTHDFQLSHLPVVVNPAGIGAGSYYEVILDINQTKASPLLSIDALQIYSRSTKLTTADTLAALTNSGATLQYDLDAGNLANEILLNYELNTGSGSGDMIAYFPTSLFSDAAQTDWIYFYSHFGGNSPNYVENDGFEEWGVRDTTPTNNVPDGGTTAILLGMGLGALGMLRRKLSV